MEVNDKLLQSLECPICTEYMSYPIRQCATGHSVCENCMKKLNKCALCQGKFTESRNLTLEAIAIDIHYPCINKSRGCQAKLSFTERKSHEMRCNFGGGISCAMEKCPWVGKIEDLAAHWASKKTTSKPYHENNLCHTKIKGGSFYVNIVNAHKKLFWFKSKLVNNKLFWTVQYIGQANDAEKYYYEIEIFKPTRNEKKIIIRDYCQSNNLDNSQLFTDANCISVNVDAVNQFITGDQLLLYYLRVGVSSAEKGARHAEGGAKAANTHKPKVHQNTGARQRDRSNGPKKEQKKKNNQQQQHQKQHNKPKGEPGFVYVTEKQKENTPEVSPLLNIAVQLFKTLNESQKK